MALKRDPQGDVSEARYEQILLEAPWYLYLLAVQTPSTPSGMSCYPGYKMEFVRIAFLCEIVSISANVLH